MYPSRPQEHTAHPSGSAGISGPSIPRHSSSGSPQTAADLAPGPAQRPPPALPPPRPRSPDVSSGISPVLLSPDSTVSVSSAGSSAFVSAASWSIRSISQPVRDTAIRNASPLPEPFFLSSGSSHDPSPLSCCISQVLSVPSVSRASLCRAPDGRIASSFIISSRPCSFYKNTLTIIYVFLKASAAPFPSKIHSKTRQHML